MVVTTSRSVRVFLPSELDRLTTPAPRLPLLQTSWWKTLGWTGICWGNGVAVEICDADDKCGSGCHCFGSSAVERKQLSTTRGVLPLIDAETENVHAVETVVALLSRCWRILTDEGHRSTLFFSIPQADLSTHLVTRLAARTLRSSTTFRFAPDLTRLRLAVVWSPGKNLLVSIYASCSHC